MMQLNLLIKACELLLQSDAEYTAGILLRRARCRAAMTVVIGFGSPLGFSKPLSYLPKHYHLIVDEIAAELERRAIEKSFLIK